MLSCGIHQFHEEGLGVHHNSSICADFHQAMSGVLPRVQLWQMILKSPFNRLFCESTRGAPQVSRDDQVRLWQGE